MRGESGSADARLAAVRALARVDARGAHASRLLATATPFERELVLGVLRWQLTLDELLARHLRTSIGELQGEVRAVLRVGLLEAARLDTPDAVAVSEAVRVAKQVAPRAAGLVNAVLRRAALERWPDADDPAFPLALRFSHPPWLVRRWSRLLGEEITRHALAADQTPAPFALLVEEDARGKLERQGCTLEDHPLVPGVALVRGGVQVAIAALAEGRAYAIDPSAVVVARVLAAVAPEGAIADLAAAPGGKSLVLARSRPRSFRLACDRHLGRMLLMRDNLRRCDRPPRLVVADASRPPLRRGAFTALLLDAPCSGTGTLRRHPEIRWRLREGDLADLARTQRGLLESAASLLAPGGLLLYATCSLEPEENEAVAACAGLEIVPIGDRLPSGLAGRELPSGGFVIAPSEWGDGFTMHLLRASA